MKCIMFLICPLASKRSNSFTPVISSSDYSDWITALKVAEENASSKLVIEFSLSNNNLFNQLF